MQWKSANSAPVVINFRIFHNSYNPSIFSICCWRKLKPFINSTEKAQALDLEQHHYFHFPAYYRLNKTQHNMLHWRANTLNTRFHLSHHVPLRFMLYKKRGRTALYDIRYFHNNPAQHLGLLGGDNACAVTKGWHNSALRLWGLQIYGMRCGMSRAVDAQCEVWVQAEVTARAHAESCSEVHSLKHNDITLSLNTKWTTLSYDYTQATLLLYFI